MEGTIEEQNPPWGWAQGGGHDHPKDFVSPEPKRSTFDGFVSAEPKRSTFDGFVSPEPKRSTFDGLGFRALV